MLAERSAIYLITNSIVCIAEKNAAPNQSLPRRLTALHDDHGHAVKLLAAPSTLSLPSCYWSKPSTTMLPVAILVPLQHAPHRTLQLDITLHRQLLDAILAAAALLQPLRQQVVRLHWLDVRSRSTNRDVRRIID